MTYRHNGGPLGEGWIARHRSVRGHWLVGHGIQVKPADPSRKRTHAQGEAWEDLTMECRYEDGTVMNGGKKMELRRGELVGAVSWLAHRWNWTPKTVRRFLDQLENDGMIELKKPGVESGTQKGKQANVVSICNYDFYQFGYLPEGQAKGDATGKQGASRGQAEGNIYKDKQGNKGTIDNPPTPQEGARSARRPKAFSAADLALCEAAFVSYNASAKQHGFSQITVATEQRRKRMLLRLADIGGLENFDVALTAIPHVPFLMGKTPPRPGQSPFKLDIDALLSTGSNLGDVLAKLIDKASSLDTVRPAEPWLSWDDAEWVRQIAEHANGIWPTDKLSPPPGSKRTACPQSVIQSERLLERYDENGISREKH